MGTAVVGGMLAATILGIFLIPVLFVLIEQGVDKIKKNKQHKEEVTVSPISENVTK